MVDADPQCNLTSFYLEEKVLDELLGESDDPNGGTIWSAIKPVIDGKGPIKDVDLYEIREGLYLCPGDVLLADYEEELPAAWTGSFARKQRDYDVMCVLSHAVRAMGKKCEADIIIYDVGPNVGPLNRTILLDVNYFATPATFSHCGRSLRSAGRLLVGSAIGRSSVVWRRGLRKRTSFSASRNTSVILRLLTKFHPVVCQHFPMNIGKQRSLHACGTRS